MQMYMFNFRTSELQFLMLFGGRKRRLLCWNTCLLVHSDSLLVLQCIGSVFVFILNVRVRVATLIMSSNGMAAKSDIRSPSASAVRSCRFLASQIPRRNVFAHSSISS